MNETNYREISPKGSDFCQSTLMLEVADPTLITNGGKNILYSTLVQKDAAKASCGTDIGFFCYVSDTLTMWAGPYLLCDNQTNADKLFAPKPIRLGDDFYLIGKYCADGRSGIAVYRASDPLGKFKFVSSFRLDIDCTPYVDRSGKVSLYSSEGGKLTRRVFSDDLMKLSAPTLLSDKLKPICSPCVIDGENGKPMLIVAEEKHLTLLFESDKGGKVKHKSKKLKIKLRPDAVSSYSAPNGMKMLLLGLNRSFALLPYTFKKGVPTFGDAILPYREEEIGDALENTSSDKGGERHDSAKIRGISVNFSAITAISIALLSAGIGVIMGITAFNKK